MKSHASSVARVAALLASLASANSAVANNQVGAWSPPGGDNWPLIAIHAVLTPDGRVLTYGTKGDGTQTGYFIYDVWDPTAGLAGGHVTLDNLTQTDLFCNSQIVLPQSGTVLMSGGDVWDGTSTRNVGNDNSTVYDPDNDSLVSGPSMNRPRWYATSTVLPDGRVYVQGGTGGFDRPEIRDPDGSFHLLNGADTSALNTYYPRNFVVPDGRIFGFDAAGQMYYVNVVGSGNLQLAGNVGSPLGVTASSAMYRPGMILHFGGNGSGATLIDARGAVPLVSSTQPLSSQRQWVTATILADGRVLATGGSAVFNELTGVNNTAEIWNPSTGQWTSGPSGSRARLYHSTALLLPDASVLVAGGGAPGPLVNLDAEIYYPSYLYAAGGGLATRPVITAAPDAVDVGQAFSITVSGGAVGRVTMVKTGAVTHGNNMDQRYIEPSFVNLGGSLSVQLPTSPADLTPGYYLLFAFNSNGVPSVAKILRVNISTNPAALVDFTPMIGRLAAPNFQLDCNADETAVGMYGNSAGTYVNRVGLQCIKIDQFGHWIGDPINRGASGTVNGAAYVRTCARDSAISGFRGRSADFVDQIDIECKALDASGRVAGSGTFLGPVGGTGGLAQGPFACSTGNPVYRFVGASGGWLDSFGVECRQAPQTNVGGNSPPAIQNPGNQTSLVGAAVSLQIVANDVDGNSLAYSATGLPAGLGIAPTTGLITGAATTAGTGTVTVTVSDGTASANTSFTWTVNAASPLVLDPMPKQPPRLAGTAATYTATSRNGINTRYKWFFGDGSESPWSTSPSVTHTFAQPTIYWLSVTATDDRGIPQTQNFSQLVHLPLTAQRPSVSSAMAIANGRLWVVNPDNDSVSVFSTANNQKLAEITVGSSPRSVAIAANGEAWVTNRAASTISVLNPGTLQVARTVALPVASQPYGIAFAPSGSSPYVVLESLGQVRRLDGASGATLATVAVGNNPRQLSINAAGSRIYVSRFITPPLPGESTATVATDAGGVKKGGEVVVVDAINMVNVKTIVLQHSDDGDFENAGAGFPNYLGAVAISPDGTDAWVPSKKDNVRRGTLRSGANLNFQNTVRAISSRIDLASETEQYAQRVDHDNASVASAAAFETYGVFLFVALETSKEVAVTDAHLHTEYFRIMVGRAPNALIVSPDGSRLYTSNFMDRTVSVHDLTKVTGDGLWQAPHVATLQSVASERLSATVLKGKQFFYDAFDPRLSRDRYLSCATCHNDGGGDGRVWDMTGFGEGVRNTISLRGKAGGHGFLHWTANFDEVQDFEGQIRLLAGGAGLMPDAAFTTGTRSQPLGDAKTGVSADLDALAAYVASLNQFARSPFRNSDGTLTNAGVDGRSVFVNLGCAACHGGQNFTNSANGTLENVGTIRQPTSGKRLGAPLTGIDTPTLRDVWATAPYLHDGSAATVENAITAHTNVSVAPSDMSKLAAYVRQIDALEPAPPPVTPNSPPTVQNPGDQTSAMRDAVSKQIVASDPNNDTLSYSASGLPQGLGIGSSTGRITGSPKKAGVFNVTVTVNDGRGGTASVTFKWTVTK